LLKCATEASHKLFGRSSYSWLRGRGDLVVFSKAGMDVLNIGPGSLEQAHSSGEYVRTIDLPRSANLIAETILQLDQWLVANS
jgi:acetylornithine deacetylase/succinyl-diaminopimelate desuccinylase-like protein